MDVNTAKFLEMTSELEQDVRSANVRSKSRNSHEVPESAVRWHVPSSSADDPDLERHESVGVTVEEVIETQLLDCYNLARQHGFAELERLIDLALDSIAREVDRTIGTLDSVGDRSRYLL